MKTNRANFKAFLFLIGGFIIVSFLFYTDNLVSQLREQLREFLEFRIKVLEQSINQNPGGEVSFVFEKVIRTADFPIIYTDAENNPMYWKNLSVPSTTYDSLPDNYKNYLQKMLKRMDEKNNPIPIRYQDVVLGYYHYGDSPIIIKLQRLPYVETFIVILFILLGYIGFNAIKKNEKRIIWVGMAKETAHQLGTPTSSLMGWLELMENSKRYDPSVIEEMKKDVARLNKIADRFSKIGSKPLLDRLDFCQLVKETIHYFEKRLPNKGKKIVFDLKCLPNSYIMGNKELLEWTMENLIKNALDAIEKKEGKITITVHENHKWNYIDVSDNGRGIEFSNRKKVFEAGYSTKKRGWGLGLSLVKRIVEEYHKGKIFVLESSPGEGTTFRIQLPKRKGIE